MEETSHEDEDKERSCQAVSPSDMVCGFPATVRCTICKSGSVMRMPKTNSGTLACCHPISADDNGEMTANLTEASTGRRKAP